MAGTEDPYATVAKGKLKLKCDTGIKKKKKKKDKKILEQVTKTIETEKEESSAKQTKTKAELAFLQQQEKNVILCIPIENETNIGKSLTNSQRKSREIQSTFG
ncbi:hypothetical protein NQ315_008017 [Exocentrus adspersus]|uniref:Uncharacterized protein n=1 Tax=Exocentrus adspersus TaxID=1586481 RepID=A0AAV8VVR8_9CUCU|nr:hypothetical protein NQ315_008017 [Exocentrus adspersus]